MATFGPALAALCALAPWLPVAGAGDGKAVQAAREGDVVRLAWDGRPVLEYRGGAGVLPSDAVKPVFKRGGYLHPVRTPSGRVVTDDYPPDHRHHHGIWFAWTKTGFEGRAPDFWNVGDGKARVDFAALGELWSGAVQAGLRARHLYEDLTSGAPKPALEETWTTRVYAAGRDARRYFLFDVEVEQTTASGSPLVLPEYHYGGLGFRGAAEWRGAPNAFFLTSEAKHRSNGHATRARWCHVSGRVEGERAGIAILSHPRNFRAPEPMRIHPSDPFFCYASSQLGRWEIVPGTPHVVRYRFASADGAPDPKEIDRLWNDFAEPPRVVVK